MAVIGLCGAHRVGKTTLGRELAKRHKNVFFVETKVSDMLKSKGLSHKDIQSSDVFKMFEAQTAVLDHLIGILEKLPRNDGCVYVVDRTPLDALAYLQMYFNAQKYQEIAKDEKTHEVVNFLMAAYIGKTIEGCVDYIDNMVMILPGIDLVEDEDKALADECYIEHLSALMLGNMTQLSMIKQKGNDWCGTIPRKCVELEDRVNLLSDMVVYLSTTTESGDSECTTRRTFEMN